MSVKQIPDGFHALTPYLVAQDAAAAIEFYKQAFGATETMCLPGPDGKVMHAELRVGDSPFMLGEACPEMGAPAPKEPCPMTLYLYVADCDATFARAIAAGAKEERPLTDMFYGDRCGSLLDPFGYRWAVATHQKDMSPEEIQAAAAAMAGGHG